MTGVENSGRTTPLMYVSETGADVLLVIAHCEKQNAERDAAPRLAPAPLVPT